MSECNRMVFRHGVNTCEHMRPRSAQSASRFAERLGVLSINSRSKQVGTEFSTCAPLLWAECGEHAGMASWASRSPGEGAFCILAFRLLCKAIAREHRTVAGRLCVDIKDLSLLYIEQQKV